jgi:CO/xanthine dehydrogenase Mo-binding subunit
MLYALPALRVEHAVVDVPVPVGFWRSVGYSANAFVVESFLDELAAAGRVDPFLMRRRLLQKERRALGVVELAGERANWTTPPKKGVHRGIAFCKSFSTYVAMVAEVETQGSDFRVTRVVCAVDCGVVINPDLVAAQMESGIVYGLSAALYQRITLDRGGVVEGNFNDYPLLRMHECPRVEVHIVPSDEPPTGVGEPGVPPIGPAVANALFAGTGRRHRILPLKGRR